MEDDNSQTTLEQGTPAGFGPATPSLSATENPLLAALAEDDRELGAAARALAIAEVITLVVKHLKLDKPRSFNGRKRFPRTREEWDASGFLARGVNKLWKSAIDRRIARSAYDSSKKVLQLNRELPLLYLRIMANDPALLAGLRTVVFEQYEKLTAQGTDAASLIILEHATSLEKLDLRPDALACVWTHSNADLAFPKLRTLWLQLTSWRAKEDVALRAAKAIRTFTCVSHVRLSFSVDTPGEDCCDMDPHIAHTHLYLMMSICPTHVERLDLRSDWLGAIPRMQLALLFDRFSQVRDSTIHISRPVEMQGILPRSLVSFSMGGPPAAIPHFLSLLADKEELPNLTMVPSFTPSNRYGLDPDPEHDLLPGIARAIEGLKARPGVQDDGEDYAQLRLLASNWKMKPRAGSRR